MFVGAYRVAASNGWSLRAALPFGSEAAEAVPPPTYEPGEADPAPSNALLTVFLWTVLGSYVIKYGETLLPFTLDENIAPCAPRAQTVCALPGRSQPIHLLLRRVPHPVCAVAAGLLIAAPTGLNVWKWSERSKEGAENFKGIL